jgi:hypothetical protein
VSTGGTGTGATPPPPAPPAPAPGHDQASTSSGGSSSLFAAGDGSTSAMPPRAGPSAAAARAAGGAGGSDGGAVGKVKSEMFDAETFMLPTASIKVDYTAFIAAVIPIYQHIITGIAGICGDGGATRTSLSVKHRAQSAASRGETDGTPGGRSRAAPRPPPHTVSSVASRGAPSVFDTPGSNARHGNNGNTADTADTGTAGTMAGGTSASAGVPFGSVAASRAGAGAGAGAGAEGHPSGPLQQFLLNLDEFITSVSGQCSMCCITVLNAVCFCFLFL